MEAVVTRVPWLVPKNWKKAVLLTGPILLLAAYGTLTSALATRAQINMDTRIQTRALTPTIIKAEEDSVDLFQVRLDATGKIMTWSKGMTVLTGFSENEMLGKNMRPLEATSPERASQLRRICETRLGKWNSYGDVVIHPKGQSDLVLNVVIRDTSDNARRLVFDHLNGMHPLEEVASTK